MKQAYMLALSLVTLVACEKDVPSSHYAKELSIPFDTFLRDPSSFYPSPCTDGTYVRESVDTCAVFFQYADSLYLH